ncbi:MAG TPA: mannose-6-phosphate isomerase, class I [Jatrophihabitans sp.]|nr:mannose-6-phosphate isomerase, class I [Jatrophihabitans sp.]
MRIIRLENTIRDYAWGSPTAIPQLLGIEPTGRPAAELWIGAHPDSPSHAPEHDQPLDALIAADPGGLLGAASVERFGPRLPFLLKVLAAERALSLQVHPNAEQARAGYEAEERAGVSQSSAERNYRDPHHKPEMAYALTEFDAFCGFRPPAETAEYLTALEVAELLPYRELLTSEEGVRAVFTTVLSLQGAARAQLIESTVAGCRRLAATNGRWAPEARAALLAAEDFPGDIGPVVALLLNYVKLLPGEAMFLAAGNVHAYLRGVCIEVLANSDNVLRCGLTPKHIDVPELVRIADFTPLPQPRWQPAEQSAGGAHFSVPVPDFALGAGHGHAQLRPDLPYLVLAGERPATVGEQVLAPWHAAFVGVGDEPVQVRSDGRIFLASPGL